jgi:hypothetical protein
VPSFEYIGPDPIDHFWAGYVAPGDVVEFAEDPGGLWKPSRKKPTADRPADPDTTEPASDTADTEED